MTSTSSLYCPHTLILNLQTSFSSHRRLSLKSLISSLLSRLSLIPSQIPKCPIWLSAHFSHQRKTLSFLLDSIQDRSGLLFASNHLLESYLETLFPKKNGFWNTTLSEFSQWSTLTGLYMEILDVISAEWIWIVPGRNQTSSYILIWLL